MHILAVVTVSGSAISDACPVYYWELWSDCVTSKSFWSAFPVQWLQLCLLSSECEWKCSCLCHSPLYDVLSSCFAAGALACFEVGQTRTIYQAVVDKNWSTAKELLDALMESKLSGSVWSPWPWTDLLGGYCNILPATDFIRHKWYAHSLYLTKPVMLNWSKK